MVDTNARTSRFGAWISRARIRVWLPVSAALFLALGQLNGVLHGMHVPYAGSYGIGDLASVLSLPPDSAQPERVLGTWKTFDAVVEEADVASSRAIATAYLIVDCVFVLAYALLFSPLILRLTRQLADTKPEILEKVGRFRLRAQEAQTIAVTADERPAGAEAEMERAILAVQKDDRVAFALLGALVGFDLIENGLQFALLEYPDSPVFWLLWLASIAKWLALGAFAFWLAALALSAARYSYVRDREGSAKERPFSRWVAALKLFRIPLLLLAVLGAGLLLNEQFADVLRRWLDGPAAPIAGFLAALLAGAVGRAVAHRIAFEADRPWTHASGVAWLAAVAAVFIPLALVLRFWLDRGGLGLIVPGGLALVLLLGHLALHGHDSLDPPRVADEAPSSEGDRSPAREVVDEQLAPLLAALPPVLLGLALIKASVPEIAFARHDRYFLLIGVGVVLLVAGGLLAGRTLGLGPHPDGRLPRSNGIVLCLGVALTALSTAMVLAAVHWTAERLGTIAIAFGFTLAMAFVALALTWVSERVVPPRIFLVLRLRRIPVVTLLILWALLASPLTDGRYHDVRIEAADAQGREPTGIRPLTLDEAFDRWLAANGLPGRDAQTPPRPDPDALREVAPLVLVTAEGGGIRAAYWTALTLDCIFGEPRESGTCAAGSPPDSVFVASGISGGSLGLASWAAHLLDPGGDEADWVGDRLEGDFLAPVVAWALYADLPNALLTLHDLPPFGKDRATVLEQAWEGMWPDGRLEREFLALWPSADDDVASPHIPLLVLGGTSVLDGCRVNSSILDAAVESSSTVDDGEAPAVEHCLSLRRFETSRADPSWALAASKDLVDFLECDSDPLLERDVRLSTAALLSARFPYVAPSGRLVPCRERAVQKTWVVDGGYFDTSGAAVIAELLDQLEPMIRDYNRVPGNPCIEPFLLQIDNHYADPPGPDPEGRPTEVQVPLRAVGGVRGAHEANARQSSAKAVSRRLLPGVRSRYAHVYPRAHPGTRAPLGWTLSNASTEELRRQLRDANAEAVDTVRSWFDGLQVGACPTN